MKGRMDLAPSFLFPRMPVLNGTDVDATRTAIREYFQATFSRYELLFETLTADEAYFVKPNSLRHPLIFYFGHTATFFINKLLLAGLLAERVDPEFEAMFAVGVDEMSWDDLDETHYRWPTVAAVRDYRRRVRAAVDAIIADAPLTLPIDWDHPMVGDRHGDRARAHPSGNLIGTDSPAKGGVGRPASVMAGLPDNGRAAAQ
ncbi:MAG: DinB family protein [Burkholderiales bacterium]